MISIIAAIAFGSMCGIIVFLWMRKKRLNDTKITADFSLMTDEEGNETAVGALIKDPAIFAAKIPLEMVHEKSLLGKGAYGEVYNGTYGDQTVAIKRLSESRRNSIKHIEGLLCEAKLMVGMTHPNIVCCVGTH